MRLGRRHRASRDERYALTDLVKTQRLPGMNWSRFWAGRLVFSALGGSLAGLLMWPLYDLTTAWITGAVAFVAFCLMFLLSKQPRRSRRYSLGGAGLGLAYLAAGALLIIGIPDRAHKAIGVAILSGAAGELWRMRGGPVKAGFYFVFGGPDPDPNPGPDLGIQDGPDPKPIQDIS